MIRWTLHLKGAPIRSYCPSAAVGHRVFSFVGLGNTDATIDVHVFNTVSLRWAELPKTTAPAGPQSQVPANRLYHTAGLVGDRIYIWGGIINFELQDAGIAVNILGDHCNALYALHVVTHRWSKPKVSGTVPEGKVGHSACVLGRVMYIFGGINYRTRYSNDVYKLDTDAMCWSLVEARGTPVPVTRCHSATLIGTRMFVFGGQGDQDEARYNDVRVFDTESCHWLSTPRAPLPEGRREHSAFVHDGELYVFGGTNFNLDRNFSDLYRFNPRSFSWTRLEPKGRSPRCTFMHIMCCSTVGGGRVVFLCSCEHVHVLELSPSLKTLCKLAVIQYRLQHSGLPYDIRWELAATTGNVAACRKSRKFQKLQHSQRKHGKTAATPAEANIPRDAAAVSIVGGRTQPPADESARTSSRQAISRMCKKQHNTKAEPAAAMRASHGVRRNRMERQRNRSRAAS